MALKHLGTEEYVVNRFLVMQVSYYLDGDRIEERHPPNARTGACTVRRYLGFSPQEIADVSKAIAAADGLTAKSSKKHDAISRLLNSKSSLTACIDAAEIDEPGRSVNIIMCTNMPNTMDFDDFSHYFAISA